MALVDVSELLLDPDFVNNVALVRRSPTVNEYGENVLTESNYYTVGVVQQADGRTLQRIPEALKVVNLYSFWVKAKIVSDGASKYPDVIIYNGDRYAVQTIFDWTNWGAGWCEGTCVREKPGLAK